MSRESRKMEGLTQKLIRRFRRLSPDTDWAFKVGVHPAGGLALLIQAKWKAEGAKVETNFWVTSEWLRTHPKAVDMDRLLVSLFSGYRAAYSIYQSEVLEPNPDEDLERHLIV